MKKIFKKSPSQDTPSDFPPTSRKLSVKISSDINISSSLQISLDDIKAASFQDRLKFLFQLDAQLRAKLAEQLLALNIHISKLDATNSAEQLLSVLFSQENVLINEAKEFENINAEYLSKIAYGWIEYYSPIGAIQIILKLTQTLDKDSKILFNQIFFIKELILSDTSNEFISEEEFYKNLIQFIGLIREKTDRYIADLLEILYECKRQSVLKDLIDSAINAVKSATSEYKIDFRDKKGILALGQSKQYINGKSIQEVFTEELSQFILAQLIPITREDFKAENIAAGEQKSNLKAQRKFNYSAMGDKVAAWVTGSILYFKGPEDRAKAIEFWAFVGKKLIALGNYHAAYMLSLGLNKPEISRLEKTFAKLPEGARSDVQEIDQYFTRSGVVAEGKNASKGVFYRDPKCFTINRLISDKVQTLELKVKAEQSACFQKLTIFGASNSRLARIQYDSALVYAPSFFLNIKDYLESEVAGENRNRNFSEKSYQYEPIVLTLTPFTEYGSIIRAFRGFVSGYSQVQIEIKDEKRNSNNNSEANSSEADKVESVIYYDAQAYKILHEYISEHGERLYTTAKAIDSDNFSTYPSIEKFLIEINDAYKNKIKEKDPVIVLNGSINIKAIGDLLDQFEVASIAIKVQGIDSDKRMVGEDAKEVLIKYIRNLRRQHLAETSDKQSKEKIDDVFLQRLVDLEEKIHKVHETTKEYSPPILVLNDKVTSLTIISLLERSLSKYQELTIRVKKEKRMFPNAGSAINGDYKGLVGLSHLLKFLCENYEIICPVTQQAKILFKIIELIKSAKDVAINRPAEKFSVALLEEYEKRLIKLESFTPVIVLNRNINIKAIEDLLDQFEVASIAIKVQIRDSDKRKVGEDAKEVLIEYINNLRHQHLTEALDKQSKEKINDAFLQKLVGLEEKIHKVHEATKKYAPPILILNDKVTSSTIISLLERSLSKYQELTIRVKKEKRGMFASTGSAINKDYKGLVGLSHLLKFLCENHEIICPAPQQAETLSKIIELIKSAKKVAINHTAEKVSVALLEKYENRLTKLQSVIPIKVEPDILTNSGVPMLQLH